VLEAGAGDWGLGVRQIKSNNQANLVAEWLTKIFICLFRFDQRLKYLAFSTFCFPHFTSSFSENS
jgi:hypothetical protein